MNHMKKKSLLLILVIILVVSKLYAKLEDEYKCFKLINVALVNENKQYRVNQNLSIQTADKQLNNMVSVGLYSGNNQMLKIEDTNESMFVLSTQKGNWLYNKKLKSPIRIGASWNINNLDINTPFLNLGLDSLGIIKAQTMLLKYNFILTTQDFYKYSTIKKLADRIDSNIYNYQEQDIKIPDEFKHKPD